jgi:hypothetical protein
MTGRHLTELEPVAEQAIALHDPLASVFTWIDSLYPGVALVLAADRTAADAAHGTGSQAYYDRLWAEVGEETRAWIQHASFAVASLWYTAWLRANGVPIPEATVVAVTPPSPLILHPIAPNPFTSSTQIRFELPAAGAIRITIHDAGGRLVRSMLDGPIPFTGGSLSWGGVNDEGVALASGVYFVRLEQEEQVAVRKIVLTR